MADLLIDVGNTLTKVAIWEGEKARQLFKLPTLSFLSHPELLTEKLKNFVWKRVGISSVVREATDALRKIFPDATFVSADLDLPIKIDYKTPETLGADRIANACGGLEFGESFAVVSAGTAVVVDLVRDSVFQGGVIFPGLKTMAKALNLETSQLPEIEILQRFQIPGKSTTECIESGILVALIGGIKETLKTYNINTILLTGGDSKILRKFLRETILVPDLTFRGIRKVLESNPPLLRGDN